MIGELVTVALPALLPAVADGIRGIVARVTGSEGAKPQNVAEAIDLMAAETGRLKALADIDKPTGQVHTWVADVRAMMRPVAVGSILLVWGVSVFVAVDPVTAANIDQLVGMAVFYLFGDRTYSYLRAYPDQRQAVTPDPAAPSVTRRGPRRAARPGGR